MTLQHDWALTQPQKPAVQMHGHQHCHTYRELDEPANKVAHWLWSRGLTERRVRREFMYSSGTTGFPKGIRRPLLSYARRHELP
ncbi:MAG: hypothetical protein V4646_02670 [Pseudomonadota bacterium]